MHKKTEDQIFIERMKSLADDETLAWARKRGMELAALMCCYKCAMLEIETKFRVLNEEYSLEHDRNPISGIKTRLKSPSSIKGKLERKNLPITVAAIEENLNDVAGIRVICSFPEDVYVLAEALLRQDDIILVQRKDYILHPKDNGYRSLHLIVSVPIFLSQEKRMMKVEIQLRTIAMEFWASLEHQLRYKKDVVFTREMADELYEGAQLSAALDLRMDALRKSVLSNTGKTEQSDTQLPLFPLLE